MQQIPAATREKFAEGVIDWEGDSFMLVALDATYVYDPNHEFRDDLTGVLGTVAMTGNVALTNGACDADDTSITVTPAGSQIRAIAICRDVGSAATDEFIYYANTQTDGTSILRTSDGVNPITFVWSNGSTRIFRI